MSSITLFNKETAETKEVFNLPYPREQWLHIQTLLLSDEYYLPDSETLSLEDIDEMKAVFDSIDAQGPDTIPDYLQLASVLYINTVTYPGYTADEIMRVTTISMEEYPSLYPRFLNFDNNPWQLLARREIQDLVEYMKNNPEQAKNIYLRTAFERITRRDQDTYNYFGIDPIFYDVNHSKNKESYQVFSERLNTLINVMDSQRNSSKTSRRTNWDKLQTFLTKGSATVTIATAIIAAAGLFGMNILLNQRKHLSEELESGSYLLIPGLKYRLADEEVYIQTLLGEAQVLDIVLDDEYWTLTDDEYFLRDSEGIWAEIEVLDNGLSVLRIIRKPVQRIQPTPHPFDSRQAG